MEKQLFVPGDPVLMENIVTYLKAKGIFDEFRHDCLADVDTKSSCQNLSQRVDGYATKFLSNETWNPELNKNELRNKLRKHIDESGMLAVGADHVVEQVINPKIQQLFLPRIIEVVHQYLNEEIEKCNRKQQFINETTISDNLDKPKTVLDPIADILSFAYSKPKSTNQTATKLEKKKEENANQTKLLDSSKIEKKKEENLSLTKGLDITPKIEKKKDEKVWPSKGLDITPKVEKKKEENVSLQKVLNTTIKVEKKEENSSMVKVEDTSSKIEKKKENKGLSKGIDIVSKAEKKEENASQPKVLDSSPEAKKEDMSDENLTMDDSSSLENNEEVMSDSIKSELLESINENSLSEMLEAGTSSDPKDISEVTKDLKSEESESSSDSQNLSPKEEIKTEEKKSESLKPNVPSTSQSVENVNTLQPSSRPSGLGKSKPSSDKLQRSGSQSSMKTVCKPEEYDKIKIKESSDSPPSNDISKTQPSKIVKTSSKEGSSLNKYSTLSKKDVKEDSSEATSKDSISKLSDISNLSSVKKDSSLKLKHKSSKDLKSDAKQLTETSTLSGKGSSSSSQYSSYESSQSSDQDKNSVSSSQEKQKHFSKHSKKEHSESSGKKRPYSESDTAPPKKHQDEEDKHSPSVKCKKSLAFQETAKTSSCSSSYGSTSDSQTSFKETADETSNGSSKQTSDKKKKTVKVEESCSNGQTLLLPPPPPPPPSSGIAISAEMSSMDEQSTQSSDDSDFSNSEVEMSSESEVEVPESSSASKIPSPKFFKEPELLNDIYDIFLFSSSSSEFEGYSSSPEKEPNKLPSDISVSPVHTSDLSSFDDELSEVEYGEDNDDDKQVKKFTIKEAKDILQAKVENRKAIKLKKTTPTKIKKESEKPSNSCIENSPLKVTSHMEVSPNSEPKRESRRERKLNPKYASSEYTSIFNSKRTSFITKQAIRSDEKQTSPNIDNKKSLSDAQTIKTDSPPPVKARISELHSACETQSREVAPEGNDAFNGNSKECALETTSSTILNHHDKNHNMLGESDTPNRTALKDKKSAIKSDNETNKDTNLRGIKRKIEEEEDKNQTKRICMKNSVKSCSSESVANENEPLNKTKNNLSLVDMKETKVKNFVHKQKVNNNGDVLNKIESVRRNSRSKSNHINE